MSEVAATLNALGDGTRRGVVEALAAAAVSAGGLATRLAVTPAVLTRHLRVLRDAGIVRATLDPRDQRRHVYELVPGPLRELRDWADDVTTFWTGQLASFADHASRSTEGANDAHR